MAHFAKVNKGVVVEVICAAENFQEQGYHKDKMAGRWVQTSYNTLGGVHYTSGKPSPDQSKAFRKNYASVGFLYDKELDAFMSPQPYQSWVLNKNTCMWEAPVARPTDGKKYQWNEVIKKWEEYNG